MCSCEFLKLQLVVVLKQLLIISSNYDYLVTTIITTVTKQRQMLTIGRSALFFIAMTFLWLEESASL